jgi:O-antigen biosynthesis protein
MYAPDPMTRLVRAGYRRARGLAGRVLRRAGLLPAPVPAVAPTTSAYEAWLLEVEPTKAQLARLRGLARRMTGPQLSILMPVFNPTSEHLAAAIDSVLAQAYPHWELCICDDASSSAEVAPLLERYALLDRRIRVVSRSQNGGIGAATADALAASSGEFITLLDHDDVLPPWSLYFVARAIARDAALDILYSDEDKLDEQGRRCHPHFKPDWNPELLYSINYFGHLVVIRRSLILAAGGIRSGYDGSQDFDLVLRCTAQSDAQRIHQIPAVLYHWRMSPQSTARDAGAKNYAHAAGVRALQSRFPDTRVDDGPFATSYRVRFAVPASAPRVSVLIPTRDGFAHLSRCIRSITSLSSYPNLELIVLNNQSRDPATLAYFDELTRSNTATVLPYDHPFNYSAINNFGARHASGEVLLLLNDDVEVTAPDWIQEMLSYLYRDGVGAVGAKLLYPDRRVQHAGVILGIGGVAGHSHKYAAEQDYGYFGRLVLPQEMSAVTGACLMVRREAFEAVGGLDDKNLGVAFNDVDFCLRLRERGWRCVWTPYAQLIHHESLSRGYEDTPEKKARFAGEVDYMMQRWRGVLERDPHYNPNLTLRHEDFSLSDVPQPFARLVE